MHSTRTKKHKTPYKKTKIKNSNKKKVKEKNKRKH